MKETAMTVRINSNESERLMRLDCLTRSLWTLLDSPGSRTERKREREREREKRTENVPDY